MLLKSFRITPRPPLFAFTTERPLSAAREREPHEAPLCQNPPASRQVLQSATYIFFEPTASGYGSDYAARKGRLTPRPPLLAFTTERPLFAAREREPHEAPLLQPPPASRQVGIPYDRPRLSPSP